MEDELRAQDSEAEASRGYKMMQTLANGESGRWMDYYLVDRLEAGSWRVNMKLKHRLKQTFVFISIGFVLDHPSPLPMNRICDLLK